MALTTVLAERQADVRILLLSANPDATTDAFLVQEGEAIRTARAGKGGGETRLQPLRARNQEALRDALADFAPDVIHFTGHGSPSGYVMLEDRAGLLLRLTGQTFARILRETNRTVRFLFLNSCRLYAPQPVLSLVRSGFISLYSLKNAVDISPLGVRAFYETVDVTREGSDAGFQLASVAERLSADQEIVALIREGEYERPEDLRVQISDQELVAEDLERGPPRSGGQPSRLERLEAENLFRVWYGTNRREVPGPSEVNYGAERSDVTRYGYCDVVIPKHHTIGSIGDSWWRKLPRFWRNDRLLIAAIVTLSSEEYWHRLRQLTRSLREEDRVLLIFIHGYNVSFAEAVLRTAQIGFDLAVPGITALFSWPSKGTPEGYPADEASIEASEGALADYIVTMANNSGATKTHLIAHSMGNRALLRACTSAVSLVKSRLNTPIQQIFLAAPDIDVDLFTHLATIYKELATRATMYVSAKDKALWSSGLVHDYPRAGYTPPITIVSGVDTIEVSNVDLSFIGHGYIAQARPLLSDMHALMQGDTSPNKRFGLEQLVSKAGLHFWRIKA